MAEASPTYFDPRKVASLKGLHLRARHIAEGYVAGLHRSPYRGFSIEFSEHREYVPGDDLRHLDWKVFGRTDKYYLKQYEDETNLVCYLVLDTSESMDYRGPSTPMAKRDYARCLAGSLAWLVLNQQDSVGLATYGETIETMLRPSNSAGQLDNIFRRLDETDRSSGTATGRALNELAYRLSKRGVVIIISDLLDDPTAILSGLRHLRHRRHDVILFHLMDPAERTFPFRRPTLFRGMEKMPQILLDGQILRAGYLKQLRLHEETLQEGCRTMEVDYISVDTAMPFDTVLNQYLSSRMARMR